MKNLIKLKKIWIAFIVIFFSGIAIGIVCGMALKHSLSKKKCRQHGIMKMRLIRHISSELKLTSDQQASVDKILSTMTEHVSALHAEQRPKIRNIIETAFDDIDKVLTEKQKIRMAELKKKMSCFHKRRCIGERDHFNRRGRRRNKFHPPRRDIY